MLGSLSLAWPSGILDLLRIEDTNTKEKLFLLFKNSINNVEKINGRSKNALNMHLKMLK